MPSWAKAGRANANTRTNDRTKRITESPLFSLQPDHTYFFGSLPEPSQCPHTIIFGPTGRGITPDPPQTEHVSTRDIIAILFLPLEHLKNLANRRLNPINPTVEITRRFSRRRPAAKHRLK